ncbi:ABC transporter permease [Chitinasiproducens palmae]|uniref:Sulfonate transport system permease protein n=1 Tax=Chitinasiproducens palmae TaxID=1770053 RepID=A0A1H2PQ06_9BURK|nr:ABC transporter permease [Chitinasiproducens palmae]SDV48902.1 sulfonate transport system permease protein [Chitinasiproducens palmae]
MKRPGRRSSRGFTDRATALVLPVALVALWQLGSSLKLISPTLLPSPWYVLQTVWYLASTGQLWRDVQASAVRVIEGYAIAAVLAIALGVAMGLFRPLNRLVDLLMQILKPVPPIAWIPLSILWFGIDEGAKVFIIVLGAFFPILTSTVDAIRQIDGRYVELAGVLELPRTLFVRKIVIPGALPQILSGLRLGLAMAWMCVVAAELIAASSGVGFLIMDGRAMSQADLVLAGMLVLGVLGKLTDDLLRHAEKRLVRWRTQFSGL